MFFSHIAVTPPAPGRSGRQRHLASSMLFAVTLLAPFALAGCGPLEELIDEIHNRGGGSGNGGSSGTDGGQTNPCAAALCLVGSHCEVQPPTVCKQAPCPPVAVCVQDVKPPSGPACGGITGKPCPGMGKCADDPSDSCDPAKGGADCGGICTCIETVLCAKGTKFDSSPSVCACVAETPPSGPACGGFTGKPCPGMATCVDDPSDSCDPATGGADCGGLCKCLAAASCTKGSKFDSSPSVCACVPEKPVCGPVCDIYCTFGNVLDSQGCPTCACNKPVPGATCPTDQCMGPAPKAATIKCSDGKTIGGPACIVDAKGVCNWTVVPCPA